MNRATAAASLLLALVGAVPAFAGPELDPKTTYVFSTSIVKWPAEAGLASFTDERKDFAFVGAFNAAGVSSENITFLTDEKATLAAMRDGLRALAKRAGAGSTLVFSFQGHGDRHKGKTYFMNYDVKGDEEQTAFAVSEIAKILDECFQGERLILVGDCCHSGALAEVVQHYEKTKRLKAASFTSATASNRSTEHWTFTEAFIEALHGDGRLDRDRNGAVTFAETDRWIHEAMKFREGQLTGAARTSSFETDFVFGKVAKPVADLPGDVELGDYVEALDREKKWYVAEVEGFADGKYKVHYVGWDRKWDETVEPARIRKPKGKTLEVGQHYEVEWEKGQWFPGTVTKAEEGWFFFIHYEGEDGSDDEWITADRARPPGVSEFVPVAPRDPKAGDRVAARWRGQWYGARVSRVEKNVIHIRYDDGSRGRVTPKDLIVMSGADEVKENDRVLAEWDDGQMYPGLVKRKHGKKVTVAWEDGSHPTDVPIAKVARIK